MIKNYLTDEELLYIVQRIMYKAGSLDKNIDCSIYCDPLSVEIYREIANVAADRSIEIYREIANYEAAEGSLKKLECLRKSIIRNDVLWYTLISSTWILSMINLIYNIF